jgi:phosphohistidine phosphatase
MRLSLLRHGIAEDFAASDAARALTPLGRAELEDVLDAWCGMGWTPGAILHSPYLRTTQTAHAVARRFPEVPVHPVHALAHDDLAAILAAAALHRDPLLVGHQPTLGELLSSLLGEPDGSREFERAGFATVELDPMTSVAPGRLVIHSGPSLLCRGR